MAVASTERFTDAEGNGWKFVWVATAGGLRLFLTDPMSREHELTRTETQSPRPSVDAETPLPLEIS